MEYNMRQLEMQCLNNKGMRVEDWYNVPIVERTWMVAGMLLPVVANALESMQISVNAQLESMRHK